MNNPTALCNLGWPMLSLFDSCIQMHFQKFDMRLIIYDPDMLYVHPILSLFCIQSVENQQIVLLTFHLSITHFMTKGKKKRYLFQNRSLVLLLNTVQSYFAFDSVHRLVKFK
jgi:hypothetical protein